MPGKGLLKASIRQLERFIEIVIFSVFVAFTALVLTQVFLRYVLRGGFSWSEELVSLALYLILTLGAGLSWSRGMDMCVDFVVNLMPTKIANVMRILSMAVVMLFSLFMIYFSIKISAMSTFRRTPILLWPMSYIYLVPIVGFGFLFLKVLTDGFRSAHTPGRELI